jgi:adenine specific DNA methylase Mod
LNFLYYGDNLPVLREHIKDETVDLVYLDQPFKSDQDYNVLFAEHGTKAAAQIKAFEDTWTWDEAAAAAQRPHVRREYIRCPFHLSISCLANLKVGDCVWCPTRPSL